MAHRFNLAEDKALSAEVYTYIWCLILMALAFFWFEVGGCALARWGSQ